MRRRLSTARRHWLLETRRRDLPGDFVAGAVVAVMLVPQAMAYALLAGLPPQVGLYASAAPVAIYAFAGSSRALAVGPVAIVSLLVATSVSKLAAPGTAEYVGYALTLALLVGFVQLGMGMARLGFLVNFLSHAVISGFTSAAALVIAASQLRHLTGIPIASGAGPFEVAGRLFQGAAEAHAPTLAVGLGAVAALLAIRHPLGGLLQRLGMAEAWVLPITRGGPLAVVALATWVVSRLELDGAGVAVVGAIPAGLPPLTWPSAGRDDLEVLLPAALAISFVGFLESFAVARALAARSREKVDADRELMALGAANLGAAVSGGYPVTGGFSRSAVNYSAGARSGLASLVTAGLVMLTLLFLTPAFERLPTAALAAIIVVAVAQLVDVAIFRRLWRYSKADAVGFLITFAAVLAAGAERGILAGAAVALALHLWRTSRPHVAVVGRVGRSEHFRNVLRHPVETWPQLLLVRIDESLYFANAEILETRLLEMVAEKPRVEHLVLITSAVNFIDGSALESLENLREELRDAGVTLHLAEVKGPVMDRLERTDFLDRLRPGRVFLSTHEAVEALDEKTTGAAGGGVGGPAPNPAGRRDPATHPARYDRETTLKTLRRST